MPLLLIFTQSTAYNTQNIRFPNNCTTGLDSKLTFLFETYQVLVSRNMASLNSITFSTSIIFK